MSDTGLQHRLAAILAADAAGYSRLMAGDDRATVAALDAARAVFRAHIEAQQGRVIDMAGDSVLAVFGTAAGAVTAALAIQLELNTLADAEPADRRMRFRIGAHLGDVIEKADGTVYGDGVNIAARLGLADARGVALLHWSLAMNLVGLGDIAAAKDAFAQVRRLAPAFVELALVGRSLYRKPDHQRRVTAFMRVAAGLGDPSASDALR